MTSGRQEGAKAIIRFEEPTVATMNTDLLFAGSVVTNSVRYLIYMQYFFSEEFGVSYFRLEEPGGSLGILIPQYTASHPRVS
jgi:hypothetical protein